jgi:hypothetical protein
MFRKFCLRDGIVLRLKRSRNSRYPGSWMFQATGSGRPIGAEHAQNLISRAAPISVWMKPLPLTLMVQPPLQKIALSELTIV